jgi:membrane-associated phospholipid phosphatase
LAKASKSQTASSSSAPPHLWTATAFLLLAFAVLAWMAYGNRSVGNWELLTLEKISSIRLSWLDSLFSRISDLASVSTIVALTILAALSLLVFRQYVSAVQIVAVSWTARLLVSWTKDTFLRDRPTIVEKIIHADGYSFPSGHALTAAAFYLSIYLILRPHLSSKKVRMHVAVITFLLIFLVSFSRLYLGVHYPTDIIGGACLGTAAAFLISGLLSRFKKGSSA